MNTNYPDLVVILDFAKGATIGDAANIRKLFDEACKARDECERLRKILEKYPHHREQVDIVTGRRLGEEEPCV